MNISLVQLEYVIALDTYRHFVTAAENCFVTQPTLSMQIQKMEEELGVTLFDRSKHPIVPTEIGALVIAQARKVIQETRRIGNVVHEFKGEVTGQIKIGMIPTVSSYLIPLFVNPFVQKYPQLMIHIEEDFTENLLSKLKTEKIDLAILATPLDNTSFNEYALYYEPFVLYGSKGHQVLEKKAIQADDIAKNELWLLQEGHCMRNQVLNLCSEKQPANKIANFEFKAGNIETLKKMVEIQRGITLLPELSTYDLTASQKQRLRYFKAPEPVREISIVAHQNFIRKHIIDALAAAIREAVPKKMLNANRKKIISV